MSFVNGFTPNQSTSFTVLSSTTALSGAFTNVASGGRITPTNSANSFQVNYTGTTIVLSDFGGVGLATAPANTSSATHVVARPNPSQPMATNTARSNAIAWELDAENELPSTRPGARLGVRHRFAHVSSAMLSSPAQQGLAGPIHVGGGGGQPATTVVVESSSQLLELLDGAEPAASGGRAVVRPSRHARRLAVRDRVPAGRAIGLPGARGNGRTIPTPSDPENVRRGVIGMPKLGRLEN